MARTESDTVTVIGGNAPLRVKMSEVSRDFFPLFEVKPENRSRDFAVPTIGKAQRRPSYSGMRFGRRRSPAIRKRWAARSDSMASRFTIVGVMPGGFDFPEKTEVWFPREAFPDHSTRSAHNFSCLRPLEAGRFPCNPHRRT